MVKSLTVCELIKQLETCRNKESFVFAYDGETDERLIICAVDDSFYQEFEDQVTDVDLNVVRYSEHKGEEV